MEAPALPEEGKEARIAATVDDVLACLPALADNMLDTVDRALQEALIVGEVSSSSEGIEAGPSQVAPASLGAPSSLLPSGFDELPENFLEGGVSDTATITLAPSKPDSHLNSPQSGPVVIKLDGLGERPPVASTSLPVLMSQNGLHYVKVELGGSKSVSAAPSHTAIVVSQAQLANNIIQSMLGKTGVGPTVVGGSPGKTATITVGPGRDAEGRLVMRQISSSQVQAGSLSPAARNRGSGRPSNGKGENGIKEDPADDIYIETRDLCRRIAYELKQHSIPQAVFAEKILCRSQGTLSDLLRNPKPWNKLKSGRETFRRMYAWLKQPLQQRLESLELWKTQGQAAPKTHVNKLEAMEEELKREEEEQAESPPLGLRSPPRFNPTPSQQCTPPSHPGAKRPRLVFTDIQKRTLQAIFKETQRPSKEMQQTIAEHLGLDLSTVQNFFMNARRRFRLSPAAASDVGPAPNQLIRPITPPPASPPPPTTTTTSPIVGRPPKKRVLESMDMEEEEIAPTATFLLEKALSTTSEPIYQTSGGEGGAVPVEADAPTPPAYSLGSPPSPSLPGVSEVLSFPVASALPPPPPQPTLQPSTHPPPSATGLSPKKRILIGYRPKPPEG